MIQYIEITNFKCFAERRVNLGRITVLAGANSAGKSSVIQSLLLSRITFERLRAISSVTSPQVSVPLNGDYLLALGNTQEVFNRDSGENTVSFRFVGTSNKAVQFRLRGDDVADSVYELNAGSTGTAPRGSGFSLFDEQFHYLNAERIGPRLKYEASSFVYPTVGFQGEYSVQVLSDKTADVDPARHRDSTQPPTLLAQARAWMEFIVPGVEIDDANLIGKLKTAEVSFSKSSPTNVGFGVSYVLPIVLAGLIAPAGCMLVIENPEAHLHPLGQSCIGQFLACVAAAGIQTVVETHSEHVINGIRIATLNGTLRPEDALVNFFTKEGGKPVVSTIHFTEKGDLDKWPRDFSISNNRISRVLSGLKISVDSMVNGNLLLESATFQLTDAELLLFAARMEAFVLAVEKCRDHGDEIYGRGDLSTVDFLGLPLYDYYDPQTLLAIQQQIPGFSRDMHLFMIGDLLNYDNIPCGSCMTLADIENEFPGANNGLLGPECDRFPSAKEMTVFSETSWHRWKVAYLTKHPQRIDWSVITHPYLPNLAYSNLLLGSECRSRFAGKDHTDFYEKAGKTAGGPMAALSQEVGKIVAEANYYQYNDRVSKLNNNAGQLRNVYSLIKNGRHVYLSVDVDNAAFEVCNHTGQHQGEYPFDGGTPKPADRSGKHDIRVI